MCKEKKREFFKTKKSQLFRLKDSWNLQNNKLKISVYIPVKCHSKQKILKVFRKEEYWSPPPTKVRSTSYFLSMSEDNKLTDLKYKENDFELRISFAAKQSSRELKQNIITYTYIQNIFIPNTLYPVSPHCSFSFRKFLDVVLE